MAITFIILWALGILTGIAMTIIGWRVSNKDLCLTGVLMTLASLIFGYVLFPIMIFSIAVIGINHAAKQRFKDQNNDD